MCIVGVMYACMLCLSLFLSVTHCACKRVCVWPDFRCIGKCVFSPSVYIPHTHACVPYYDSRLAPALTGTACVVVDGFVTGYHMCFGYVCICAGLWVTWFTYLDTCSSTFSMRVGICICPRVYHVYTYACVASPVSRRRVRCHPLC